MLNERIDISFRQWANSHTPLARVHFLGQLGEHREPSGAAVAWFRDPGRDLLCLPWGPDEPSTPRRKG